MADRQPPSRLDESQLAAALAGPARRWQHRGNALVREFAFASFVDAFAFMTEIAAAAERQRHHPDWRNVYARVEIAWTTHDAGGITALDVAMARQCDEYAERFAQRPDNTR